VGVGQALALQVVAEGIEAQSQMSTLHAMGCEMAQGFLVGKPSPAEVAESLLAGDASLALPASRVGENATPAGSQRGRLLPPSPSR